VPQPQPRAELFSQQLDSDMGGEQDPTAARKNAVNYNCKVCLTVSSCNARDDFD